MIIAATRAWVAMKLNTVGQRQQAVMELDMMNAEKKEHTKKKSDRFSLVFSMWSLTKCYFFS